MTVHLPEDLARFIHDAVRTGRYAREDDVIRDAVSLLKRTLQEADETADSGAGIPGTGSRSPSRNSTGTWRKSA